MSSVVYNKLYLGEQLTNISFTPQWSGHNGFSNQRLGRELWHQFPLPGWKMLVNNDLDFALFGDRVESSLPRPPADLVDDCQRYIHCLMDEAYRQINLNKAIHLAEADKVYCG